MKTALILPAYNEAKHIADMVHRALGFVDKLIVVDDCSQDETFDEAKKAGAMTLRHRVNLGKASALKTGCEAAILLGSDVIGLMDSDGQHKPEDLPRFLETLENENMDIIVGSRYGGDKMPLIRKIGNKLLEYTSYNFHCPSFVF